MQYSTIDKLINFNRAKEENNYVDNTLSQRENLQVENINFILTWNIKGAAVTLKSSKRAQ